MHLPLPLLLLSLSIIPASALSPPSANEKFEEKLTLRPLPDGKLHAHFEFLTTVADPAPGVPFVAAPAETPLHTTLLPLSLTQLLRTYGTTELHLSLVAGKWDYLRWGQPATSSLRTGAEMWAWVSDAPTHAPQQSTADMGGGQGEEKSRWQGLTNGLAGLFCASLSSQMEQRTTSPKFAFRPEGDLPDAPHTLYHASHPSESICTENLTPFLKLLPCKSRAGLGELLNPHRVFAGDWHGLGVHVRWKEGNGEEPGRTEVLLEVNIVFDPVRMSRGKRDWSFSSLFDRHITRSCPAASTSTLHVLLPAAEEEHALHDLTPPPLQMLADNGRFEAVYDLSDVREEVDVGMKWLENEFDYTRAHYPRPDLSIRRSLSGGSGLATLNVLLSNTLDTPRRVLYVETLPWFVSLFLHTLRTDVDGVVRENTIQSLSYLPPVSPKPTLLELTLLLPANSEVHMSLQLEKGFIRYTEHQPDASRGWDLPAAVVFPLLSSQTDSKDSGINSTSGAIGSTSSTASKHRGANRVYSPTLLVDLPTPDFSMPYNVIIMTSTLVALFFGSVFNCLTRKFVVLRVADKNTKEDKGAKNIEPSVEKGKGKAS